MIKKEQFELTEDTLTESDLSILDGEKPGDEKDLKQQKTKEKKSRKKKATKSNRLDDLIEANKNICLPDVLQGLNSIKTTQDTNISSIQQEMSNIKDDISASKKNVLKEISNIQNTQKQNEKSIKQEIDDLKEQFVLQMAQFFNNVSFAEETEDIKDFISVSVNSLQEEFENIKSDDVSQNLETELQTLSDKVQNAKDKINELMLGSQNEDVYALSDIESDIARLRLLLDGIDNTVKNNVEQYNSNYEAASQKVDCIVSKVDQIGLSVDKVEQLVTEQNMVELKDKLDLISEDTASISKRTNKLILTSDDSNRALKQNVEEFQKILTNLNENIEGLSAIQIKNSMDKLYNASTSILKSNQIMNEAFMHLAEWIDSTSESFDILKHNSELISTSLQNKEACIIEEIENKYNNIENKLDSLEENVLNLADKLSAISKQKNNRGVDDDLKGTIDFIASQSAAANENSREIKNLFQKVEMLEYQLNRFEKGINRILSYIDEE